MGTDDQTHFLKVSHDISHGGRGQFDTVGSGQGTGTHRLAVSDIALYQGLEQQLGTIIEHGHPF
jgi:hypothetical protein